MYIHIVEKKNSVDNDSTTLPLFIIFKFPELLSIVGIWLNGHVNLCAN